jgi:non-heme chloroperoxidase
VFAGKSVGQVADHFEAVIRTLDRKPAVVGHSFGGLLTQILAGRGCFAVSVAIDPAPFRGVLPLPLSALKAGRPVLGNRDRQPQPAHRGGGGHQEPRARAAADHQRRKGPHDPVGPRQRGLQEAGAQRGRHGDRRDPGRGHALTIDSGWREVADTALKFVQRFV